MSVEQQTIGEFLTSLAAKQPTPGGGASAAVGAAVGAATASMSAAYTQRKKDIESGAAEHAQQLQAAMDVTALLQTAQDDAEAYEQLQLTWKKDCPLSDTEKQQIAARALEVPTKLVEACYGRILAIQSFLPHCNPNITSDAKVGIHVLAGAARAAYQTVLVNSPSKEEKEQLLGLLKAIRAVEDELLF